MTSIRNNFISVPIIFNTALVKKRFVLLLYKLLDFIMQVSIQKQLYRIRELIAEEIETVLSARNCKENFE